MKNKKLVIAVLAVVAVILGIMLIKSPCMLKGKAKKTALPEGAAKTIPMASKEAPRKVFSKDMGGLTVKMRDLNNKEMHSRISAYMSGDKRSSIYTASFASNRMQELLPGSYDLQIDTLPPMFYKGVEVSKGKETVEDLGVAVGSVDVKLLSSRKKNAYITFRVLHQKSGSVVASGTTNRPVTILPGIYDIEINTMPRQSRKDVRVDAGKETVVDSGEPMGSLTIKVLGENGKEVRLNARIKKSDTNDIVANTITNRPIEVLKGTYAVELYSSPAQTKKDIIIEAGSESTVEFTAQSIPMPVKVRAPAKNETAKKKGV